MLRERLELEGLYIMGRRLGARGEREGVKGVESMVWSVGQGLGVRILLFIERVVVKWCEVLLCMEYGCEVV